MNALIALAALGPWAYADFLADPRPAATADPEVKPPAPAAPATVSATAKPPAAPKPAPAIPPPPARLVPPPAPSQVLFRLVDASGRAWEHADPAYLRAFVEARDRDLLAPRGAVGGRR